jgi:alkanesulfonate monooxygenase SsuD/methylene tetrahydromethanopterin reductase-like flavin-dependent oxidoreductase (luciferase family)
MITICLASDPTVAPIEVGEGLGDVSIGLHLKDPPIDDLRVVARMAQQADCTHLFLPELSVTLAGPATGRDPFVAASVALESTTSLLVGTGVVGTIFHTPHHLALAAATLNEQSGGRFVLGVGVAHREFAERLGVPFPPSVLAHARDASRALRSYAADGLTFGGGFPIWLAALGPKMVDIAIGEADGVILNWVSPESVVPIAEQARRLDRPWTLSAMVRVGPRGDLEEDAERYRSMFANYGQHFDRQGLDTSRAVVSATCLATEELDRLPELASAYAAAGVDVLILNPSGMGLREIEGLMQVVSEAARA